MKNEEKRESLDVSFKHLSTSQLFLAGVVISSLVHVQAQSTWLRVPPPSFFRFSDLENGKSDRAEIFIIDSLPEKMRHVFEEKIW